MPIIYPKNYRDKDLTLDVRLETCVGEQHIDFTGKKSYNFGLFRNGIGFGITDIKIVVNPSMQPIVEISFKDLYGNTLFGTQRVDGQSTEIDYSVLYNWPPPKFYLTFKGYLGSPVTWVLNLKKVINGYDSSDSSYTINASFVPNQWGVFADIPFLYLLGVKGLKKNLVGVNADTNENAIETIFDIIKIGKTVDVKKNEFTKQFDTLKNQTSSVYSDIIGAVNYSKVVTSGTLIDGTVNGDSILDFSPFAVTIPKWLTPNEIASRSTTSEGREVLNAFLVNKCLFTKPSSKFDGTGPLLSMANKTNNIEALDTNLAPGQLPVQIPVSDALNLLKQPLQSDSQNINEGAYTTFQKLYSNPAGEKTIREENRAKLAPLKENLSLIDKAVQTKFIEKTTKELDKIVISQIFSRLAGDTGYLVGRILEAGLNGFSNNSQTRSEDTKIVGKNFPLVFKEGDNDGLIELPATRENSDNADYGVDDNEMKFVEEFITAVSEGIAENKDFEEASGIDGADAKIKVRVNNLEMLQSNPYASDYNNIAGNILLRSGIIGYITRSNDPNKPGDYGNTSPIDNDQVSQISELARKDIDNVSTQNISDLKATDLLKLKKFCNFMTRLFKPNGEINEAAGANGAIQLTDGLLQSSPDEPLSDALLNFQVEVLNDGNESRVATVGEFIRGTSPNSSVSAYNILSTSNPQMVNSYAFRNFAKTDRFYNNNLPWFIPMQSCPNKYVIILFEGTDATDVQSIQSSKTDVEFSSQDEKAKDEPNSFFGITFKKQQEPLGVIPVNSFYKEENGVKTEAGRVETLNKYIDAEGFADEIKSDIAGLGVVALAPLFGVLGLITIASRDSRGGVLSYEKIKQNGIGAVTYDAEDRSTEGEKYEKDTSSYYINYKETIQDDGTVLIEKIQNYQVVDENSTTISENQLPAKGLAYTIYAHTYDDSDFNGIVWGPFMDAKPGESQRVALYSMCDELLKKITDFETKKSQATGTVISKANEQKNEIYKLFHNIFQQWNALAYSTLPFYDIGDGRNNLCSLEIGNRGDLAVNLEKLYGGSHNNIDREAGGEIDGSFIYEYPFNGINPPNSEGGKKKSVDVKKAIINIDPLYKPDAKTTVLNIIQQICTKNNFMFVPIPGNGAYRNISDVFTPDPVNSNKIQITNYFHVLFMPTPESRSFGNNTKTNQEDLSKKREFAIQAIGVRYGSVDNQVFKNLTVNLEDSKPTAESIVNLQRLVSNENKNKVVTKDCSTLSVLQGRSFTASLEMLGNAQIFPLQFFYIENSPLFEGLYQVMKVEHNITPNNMTTKMEGIRLAFANGGYGGTPPVTNEVDKNSTITSTNVPAGIISGPSRSNVTANNNNSTNIGLPISATADGMISKYVSLQQATFNYRNAELNNNNTPNEQELTNMKYVAQNIYDKLVDKFGKSNINVNSFFRNEVLNKAVGGASGSWHRIGSAIDIGTLSTKVSNADIYYYILRNLPFTELIWEYGSDSSPNWVHVALNKDYGVAKAPRYSNLGPKGGVLRIGGKTDNNPKL